KGALHGRVISPGPERAIRLQADGVKRARGNFCPIGRGPDLGGCWNLEIGNAEAELPVAIVSPGPEAPIALDGQGVGPSGDHRLPFVSRRRGSRSIVDELGAVAKLVLIVGAPAPQSPV